MKKGKLFLLLGLLGLSLPLAISNVSYQAMAEGGEEEPIDTSLEYEEEQLDDYEQTTVRHYKNFSPVSLEEHFKAPYGCLLKFGYEDENIEKLTNEIANLPGMDVANEVQMFGVVSYRVVNGSKIYANSEFAWNVDINDMTSYLEGVLPTFKLYELEEKIADVSVGAIVEFQCYVKDGDDTKPYVLTFDVEQYHINKYENGDILQLHTSYYRQQDEDRINIRAEIIDGFFDEEYGFITDGREPYEWDETQFYENYRIDYIDAETNLILNTDDDHETTPGIETYKTPDEPFTLFARLTFSAGGVDYVFYSNETKIGEKITGLLIDGYNNRTEVGVNESHKLRLVTDFDYQDVLYVGMSLTLENGDDVYIVGNHTYDSGFMELDEPSDEMYSSINENFFEFDFNYDKAGTFALYLNISIYGNKTSYHQEGAEFEITVTNTPKQYTPIEEALTLNQTGRLDCVVDGDSIELEASLSNDILNDGEVPTFEWSASRLNVVEMKEDDNKLTVLPIGSGVVTIAVTCSGVNFQGLTRSVVLNVIDNIYDISSISIPNEFHYSGKDLTVSLSVDKFSSLVNFSPEWSVTNKNGEEVPFVDNGDLSITIVEPEQNDYTITVSYKGVEIDSQVVQVRRVNVNEFIKHNILWIALCTIALLAITIVLQKLLDKSKSLVDKIEKTVNKFTAIDRHSPNVVKELNKIKLSIFANIDYAKNLNMNALNQYEKTIRYLGKSLADIKLITKDRAKLTEQEYEDLYNKLEKDLNKSLIVAREIENAKDLALTNSYNANQNNYVKLDEENKKEITKKSD